MLRAEAGVFMPQPHQEMSADFCKKMYNGKLGAYGMYREDHSATAAPSPALTSVTSSSAWGSPNWNYDEYSAWSAQRTPLGAYPVKNGTLGAAATEFDQFVLPEAEESEETEEAAAKDDDKFALTGLSDLNNALSDLLRKRLPSGFSEGETVPDSPQASPALSCQPPPGLAPPPGLSDSDATEDQCAQHGGVRKDNGTTAYKNRCHLPPNTTTIMLRNIPNKYSQDRLVEQLHADGYKGLIDFVYLPIDFKNQCNVGYAFLNFRTVEACTRFASEYHNMTSCEKLPGFKSKKICEVAEAKCQGCDKNVSRLQSSPVMAQLVAKPEWLPRLFDTNGKPLEFPLSSLDHQSYQYSASGGKGMSRRSRTWSGNSGKGGDYM